jgi:hypothetical protein
MRAITILSAIILTSPAMAGIEDAVLHGVSVGPIRAWSGPDAIPGMASSELEERANAYLRSAGVPFDRNSPASLLIKATTFTGPSGMCFVYLDARLIEEARLERNGLRVEASSWKDAATVESKLAECGKVVGQAEDARLRDFVEHYKAMNPEAPTS